MIRLLQIEFIKLWNSKASKVLIFSYFILILSLALISMIRIDNPPIVFNIADQGVFDFPYIWHLNTYIASWFKLFFAIVIVSMTANEYSNKTIKQNLIDGLSKKEFLLSKFLMVITFSIISTVFVFLVSLVLGMLYSNYDEFSIVFSNLEYFLAYFVKLVGFFSFCLFLGILVKRSAFALGFLILWWAIFENVIFRFGSWKLFSKEVSDTIMHVLPLSSMSNLIIEPFSKFKAVKSISNQLGTELTVDYAVHWYNVLIVLAWVGIFMFLSYTILKKRDL
ncbi:ABC transporter permease [Cellulophaga baltica]|uniref:ABC transporter permease n=1 Tax=Cellulophaga TaxID=104264 RepID=UPI001C06B45B|nr:MULTISPECIES: ABC transporter permease subunit [Cellulophaga]MBU2996846.1 ABC transporter permease [Cellulophaga baltica]MDO6768243.1 ABC transporter permease subunit [Cellulophaga sp. 1_MG-2023]